MAAFRKLFRIIRNKYVYITLAFLVWVTVFDRNNLVHQYKLYRELRSLQQQKAFYLEEIRRDSIAMAELMSSLENLEKFGRERYLMKKEDEDIFLIIREGSE